MFEFLFSLKQLYGAALFEHLKGWDDAIADYNPDFCRFPMLFGVTVGIALAAFLLYFYLINHPRFNRWWSWLIVLAVVAISSFGYGHYVVSTDIAMGNIAPSLQNLIGTANCYYFATYCMAVSSLIFFILSLLFRRWSRNCKHSPWKLIIRKK